MRFSRTGQACCCAAVDGDVPHQLGCHGQEGGEGDNQLLWLLQDLIPVQGKHFGGHQQQPRVRQSRHSAPINIQTFTPSAKPF